MLRLLIFGVALMSFVGCATLKTYEVYEYKNMESKLYVAGMEPETPHLPAVAGVLNLFPGFGNAYLGQWGVFVVNLLFWPASVVWGIPQAVIDANNLNKKETLYYFKFGPGKEMLTEYEQKNVHSKK